MAGFSAFAKQLATVIETNERYLLEGSREIVEELAEEGAARQAEILEDAHTRTGLARADGLAGGFPGRHLTGHMIDEISYDVEQTPDSAKGTFGWVNPEDYFGAQDDGTEYIEAANSLSGAHQEVSVKLKRRVIDLSRGKQ